MGSSSSSLPCTDCSLKCKAQPPPELTKDAFKGEVKEITDRYPVPTRFVAYIAHAREGKKCHFRVVLEEKEPKSRKPAICGLVVHVMIFNNEVRPFIEPMHKPGFPAEKFRKMHICEIDLKCDEILKLVWDTFSNNPVYNLLSNNCQHFANRFKNKLLEEKKKKKN